MTNNTNYLLWNCNKKLLNEFAYEMIARQLKPKSIIFYNRIAFIYPPLNIRITIDRNISTSYDYVSFLSKNFFKYPLQEKKNNILEVKFLMG